MNFNLSDVPRAIREAVAAICKPFDKAYWLRKDMDGGFPHEFHAAIAKAGWRGVAMPQQYGGAGLGITEAALMLETVSASGAGLSGCSAIHMNIFGLNPVVVFGSEEQKARWLPRVARGEALPLALEQVLLDGHAIEVRLCAEDENYLPHTGRIAHFSAPSATAFAPGPLRFDHAIEGGSEPPKSPLLFTKFVNALNAHNAPVKLHAISQQIDFEAELAVVIGKRASQVKEEEALDYVFGYTCLNDVSARDLQFADGQWVRGKGLDGFAPLGPFITTKDEVADPQALKIEGILNGEVMQSSNTDKMIFKVAYFIHYITQAITLEPGDVIATGTPEGVGVFRTPPVLLKDGDVFDVVIEKLGTLRNNFVNP